MNCLPTPVAIDLFGLSLGDAQHACKMLILILSANFNLMVSLDDCVDPDSSTMYADVRRKRFIDQLPCQALVEQRRK